MYRSSPFRSTLNTGYIKLWTCVALDQCKLWTPFAHFCPYFHTPYTLLCPKDEFTFTFRTGLIWKIDNPCTTLFLAPGSFDNPYKGAESAGCHKLPINWCRILSINSMFVGIFFQPFVSLQIWWWAVITITPNLSFMSSQVGFTRWFTNFYWTKTLAFTTRGFSTVIYNTNHTNPCFNYGDP